MKKYFKTNLISFIIAGIIVSGGFVFAAVTFPSNEVSYSNGTSGLNSNNVQGAIDELYETCTRVPAGEQIIEDAGLEKDQYECRYFFTGANPNNYITFNNEKWRIISVECDGTIKIMREVSIGTMAWDTSRSNNWTRLATLNTYLNGTYYNGLNVAAQSKIVDKDFSIGGITYNNNDLSNQIKEENSNKWNGKIALPTLSEYIRTNSNQSSCGTLSVIVNNYSVCLSTSWMNNAKSNWWTLSPMSSNSLNVFIVGSNGYVSNYPVYGNYNVHSTLYLSSDIQITGGDGSQSNPYQIQ